MTRDYTRTCPFCDGTGEDGACPTCGGSIYVLQSGMLLLCPDCTGSGVATCPVCSPGGIALGYLMGQLTKTAPAAIVCRGRALCPHLLRGRLEVHLRKLFQRGNAKVAQKGVRRAVEDGAAQRLAAARFLDEPLGKQRLYGIVALYAAAPAQCPPLSLAGGRR